MVEAFHDLSAILDSMAPRGSQMVLSMTEDWAQGRATFGGILGAAAVRAMRQSTSCPRPLRAILVQFVGPVAPTQIEIDVTELRSGRSVTHLQATIRQHGTIQCLVSGTFGEHRESVVNVPAPPLPESLPCADAPPMPYVPGVTPVFSQHLEYRWTLGDFPFSSSERPEVGGWCRFRNPQPVAPVEQMVALVDAWPGPVLPMLPQMAPSSTMTWSLNVLHHQKDIPPDGWWFFRSVAATAGRGYANVHAMLWDPLGRAAASSVQMVAVFG